MVVTIQCKVQCNITARIINGMVSDGALPVQSDKLERTSKFVLMRFLHECKFYVEHFKFCKKVSLPHYIPRYLSKIFVTQSSTFVDDI
jgi:hypothetical protein